MKHPIVNMWVTLYVWNISFECAIRKFTFSCSVDRLSRYNCVKKNQFDAQIILSIFRQHLHVSGASRPIIRRYNIMYTTVGTYYFFLDDCLLSWKDKSQSSKKKKYHLLCIYDSSWNVMAHGDARQWKWRGNTNGVCSQYPSHYLGTWCIQHYYRWCAQLGCQ